MKIFLLYLIILAVFDMNLFYLIHLWWFDYLHCSFGTLPFCAPFYFFRILYSIPRASQMDSLWSLRILSPTSYFLEADKTGGFALTSDWLESCSSKLQCKGCLALTSNDFVIYTVHSDKSEPIHMEGLYTYRIHTMLWALHNETHQLGNFSFLTPKE